VFEEHGPREIDFWLHLATKFHIGMYGKSGMPYNPALCHLSRFQPCARGVLGYSFDALPLFFWRNSSAHFCFARVGLIMKETGTRFFQAALVRGPGGTAHRAAGRARHVGRRQALNSTSCCATTPERRRHVGRRQALNSTSCCATTPERRRQGARRDAEDVLQGRAGTRRRVRRRHQARRAGPAIASHMDVDKVGFTGRRRLGGWSWRPRSLLLIVGIVRGTNLSILFLSLL
jgi:hypothetical protein